MLLLLLPDHPIYNCNAPGVILLSGLRGSTSGVCLISCIRVCLIGPFTMLGLYSGLPYEPSAEMSNRLLEGRVQLCLLIVGVVKNNDFPLPRRNDRPA